jgi:hypothetical protein
METIKFNDKKLISIGTYWHINQLVGINFRYMNRVS